MKKLKLVMAVGLWCILGLTVASSTKSLESNKVVSNANAKADRLKSKVFKKLNDKMYSNILSGLENHSPSKRKNDSEGKNDHHKGPQRNKHCHPVFSPNIWTWMNGSSSVNADNAVYGTKGVPATTNTPGGAYYPVSWTDNSGNFWVFGGFAYDSAYNAGFSNQLWKYVPGSCTSGQPCGTWTFVKGTDPLADAGASGSLSTYTTRGIGNSTNTPSSRYGSHTWVDSDGNLWLFGGLGYDSLDNQNLYDLNDLWVYSPSLNEWTYVSGNVTESVTPTVSSAGTIGLTVSSNYPSERDQGYAWNDGNGNFWLFGGETANDIPGYQDPIQGFILLNDLWQYTPNRCHTISSHNNCQPGNWTWMSGTQLKNQLGIYGTEGKSSSSNIPGCRFAGNGTWVDSRGSLWMFGGYGSDSAYRHNLAQNNGGVGRFIGDLWKYDPENHCKPGQPCGKWTWMSGRNSSDRLNGVGTYGTLGTGSSNNIPGSRTGGLSWVDVQGNFWMYGGFGESSSLDPGNTFVISDDLNDLWKYKSSNGCQPNHACGTWTWMGGDSTILFDTDGNQLPMPPGAYGTEAVPNASNYPGGRDSGVNFIDSHGNFWLFGGEGYSSDGYDNLNDLWKMDVDYDGHDH